MAGKGLTDKLDAVWTSIDELCSGLSDEQWATQTDCPGWDAKDNISHIIGTESMLLGRPAPEHDPGDKPWVRNPIGKANEVQVDYRRGRPGAEVLDEFRQVTGERLKQLRSFTEDDFNQETNTPLGPGTVASFLEIRIMDCWVHEQDIRRALGKPGNLTGPVAEHALGRHAGALGFVVGKKVAPPAGTTVVFDVDGFGAVGIEQAERAKQIEPPASPDVKLSMDMETFNCLCCGRKDADWAAGRVKISGDTALGRSVLEQMNFMI